jgi:hypothetical protein
MAIKTKGTGASNNRTVTVSSGTDIVGAVHRLNADDDGDGVPEQDIEALLTPTTSSMAIKTKGTGAAHNRTVTIGSSTDTSGATQTADCDDDGDGVAESSVQSRITPTTSSLAIKTKGTSAQRLSFTAACDDSSSSTLQACDDDGDGQDETTMSSTVSRKSGSIVYLDREGAEVLRSSLGVDSVSSTTANTADLDGDGLAETSISSSASSSRAALAIKTKGTSVQRLSVTADCDDTDASLSISADLDGDGLADRKITEQCDDGSASIAIDEPGVHIAISGGGGGGGGSVGGSISIDEPGVHVAMTSGGASGAAEIAIDEPGVHVAIARKGWDGTIKGNFHIDSGGARTVNFDGDGVGYVSKRFGIGDTSPTNPLSMASGAHCTPGGVWTNASDMNLKENFQEVDGAKLLEKIESLPISEWNYKNESDDVKHIGPTAQDFQATFGVGSDGKSISTIDPSGIALAAIKQLKKENAELKKQVEELSGLKAEFEALKQLLTEKK